MSLILSLQLFLSLMALKRATRSQRRRAELDTQQKIISDNLQKDLDAEVRVITDDVDNSLQEANDLLAGQVSSKELLCTLPTVAMLLNFELRA